jgi:hypothetical protein
MGEAEIIKLAVQAGIKFDSWGSPVIDHKRTLIEFANLIRKVYEPIPIPRL